MTIKAIETTYKGGTFRSRLEARWAVLDQLRLKVMARRAGIVAWNRALLEVLRDIALGEFDAGFRQGIQDEGLDPNTVLAEARRPEDVATALIRHLKADHAAEVKALTDKHASEIRLHTVNAEGLRARALAGDSPPILTGGRTSGAEHIYTRAELASMSMDEYRRNRETIDRQAAAGLIR